MRKRLKKKILINELRQLAADDVLGLLLLIDKAKAQRINFRSMIHLERKCMSAVSKYLTDIMRKSATMDIHMNTQLKRWSNFPHLFL